MKKKTERTRNSRIKQHFRVVYSLLFNNIPEPFYILKIVFIFSTLFFAYSSNTDKENLIDNQELPKLMIIAFILTTFTFDSRVILTLKGERVKSVWLSIWGLSLTRSLSFFAVNIILKNSCHLFQHHSLLERSSSSLNSSNSSNDILATFSANLLSEGVTIRPSP